jgi:hypothetical protein
MGQLCVTCHARDDVHRNALGPQCGDCHTQRSFSGARFDHNRVGCGLKGAHRLLPCSSCHLGGNFMALSPSCVSCHRRDAVRGAAAAATAGVPGHAALTRCTPCHNPWAFSPASPDGPVVRETMCR